MDKTALLLTSLMACVIFSTNIHDVNAVTRCTNASRMQVGCGGVYTTFRGRFFSKKSRIPQHGHFETDRRYANWESSGKKERGNDRKNTRDLRSWIWRDGSKMLTNTRETNPRYIIHHSVRAHMWVYSPCAYANAVYGTRCIFILEKRKYSCS